MTRTSPSPTRKTMASFASVPGFPSRWTTPLGMRTKSPGPPSTLSVPPGPTPRRPPPVPEHARVVAKRGRLVLPGGVLAHCRTARLGLQDLRVRLGCHGHLPLLDPGNRLRIDLYRVRQTLVRCSCCFDPAPSDCPLGWIPIVGSRTASSNWGDVRSSGAVNDRERGRWCRAVRERPTSAADLAARRCAL